MLFAGRFHWCDLSQDQLTRKYQEKRADGVKETFTILRLGWGTSGNATFELVLRKLVCYVNVNTWNSGTGYRSVYKFGVLAWSSSGCKGTLSLKWRAT